MKFCIFGDLHLPYNKNSINYDAFEYFISEINKEKPDYVFFAGDFTADGDREAADEFFKGLRKLSVPYAIIPGNSDLRDQKTANKLYASSNEGIYTFDGCRVILINDSNGELTNNGIALLKAARNNDHIIMHHPFPDHKEKTAAILREWRNGHPENTVITAHKHCFSHNGNDYIIRAADPDKAIGGSPSISFFDGESLTEKFYDCPVPTDIFEYLGISCYDPVNDIPYAVDNSIKTIELRSNATEVDREKLKNLIAEWRKSGGKVLSLHAPDIVYNNGNIGDEDKWNEFSALADELNPDRITLHVPDCSVNDMAKKEVFDGIVSFAAKVLEKLPENCRIGIENMHMTAKDTENVRRFGYLPSEVLLFKNAVEKVSGRKPGCTLDVGHARNNAPFSKKYTLSVWYAELGKHCNGYHIHQVTEISGKKKNHTPITDVYGRLISYASFFAAWENGKINKAPVILEIRNGGYKASFETFINNAKRQS